MRGKSFEKKIESIEKKIERFEVKETRLTSRLSC